MPTLEDVQTWHGREVRGPDDEKVGKVEQIYLDEATGRPEWAAIKTGLFGGRSHIVPIEGAQTDGDAIRVAHTKDQIKDAPSIDADEELSPEEEQRLYAHYGRDYGFEARGPETDPTRSSEGSFGGAPPVGDDVSGPETDNAMTRSEEEMRVGTASRETGRARLRKYIVTEQVQTTVPVQREEVRVEREPITEANAGQALDGPDLTEEEHEVTLRAEEPVVEKRVVPKERVRLSKDTVTDEQTVSDEVRKEQIESEGDGLR